MYYILLSFIYLLSWLPMPVLYAIGDFVGFFLFKVIGYRRKVVMQNLRNSFPEKTPQEIEIIANQFFDLFIETWMETIKFLTLSPKGIDRMLQADYSLFERLFSEGKSCQLMTGHFMNWELYNMSVPAKQPLAFLGIYMRITNPAMERLFRKIRGRFGTVLIPAQEVKKGIQQHMHKPYILVLGADQSPGIPAKAHWLRYLNQPTAFAKGPAKNACSNDLPVVFTWLEKLKRGRYILHVEMLEEHPAMVTEEALTLKYVRRLEEIIHAHPDNYLWSHKRWKHAWKEEYKPLWIDAESAMPA